MSQVRKQLEIIYKKKVFKPELTVVQNRGGSEVYIFCEL